MLAIYTKVNSAHSLLPPPAAQLVCRSLLFSKEFAIQSPSRAWRRRSYKGNLRSSALRLIMRGNSNAELRYIFWRRFRFCHRVFLSKKKDSPFISAAPRRCGFDYIPRFRMSVDIPRLYFRLPPPAIRSTRTGSPLVTTQSRSRTWRRLL